MKVIILAAGRGSRLLPLTKELPKCLLPVSPGKSVLEYQLDVLRECGIRDIVVVSGFKTDMVDEVIKARPVGDGSIENLFNPFFHIADNLASCWMTRAHMSDDFIIVNGDTLFAHGVLDKVLSDAHSPITVTIDRKPDYDADDMKVELDGDRLLAIGKGLPLDRVNGESIGLLTFRGRGPGLYVDALETAMRTPEGLESWFLSSVDDLAKTGVVGALSIEGLRWAEIDTHEDLAAAQALFGDSNG